MNKGKATEKRTIDMAERYLYPCDVIRLPDKYDTGNYEDIRPSDLIVVVKGRTYYIECKETAGVANPRFDFSCLSKGQIGGMLKAAKTDSPYAVVFCHLKSQCYYIIPAKEILAARDQGKKSFSFKELQSFLTDTSNKDEFIQALHGRP
jgi:penicillin-binding protein-related factor A (putative recombinase)